MPTTLPVWQRGSNPDARGPKYHSVQILRLDKSALGHCGFLQPPETNIISWSLSMYLFLFLEINSLILDGNLILVPRQTADRHDIVRGVLLYLL